MVEESTPSPVVIDPAVSIPAVVDPSVSVQVVFDTATSGADAVVSDTESLMDTSELPRDEYRDLGEPDGPEELTSAPAGEASTTRVGEGFPPTSLPTETGAVSLSSPRAEDVVVPELEIPVPPSLNGQRIAFSIVLGEDSPVGQWADYLVARAMDDRRNNLPLMVTRYEQGLGMRPHTEVTGFVPGVLEGAGMLAPYPMRSGATYEQMRNAVDLIGARLAAGGPLDFRQMTRDIQQVARDVGMAEWPKGVWRVLGWAIAAMGLFPVAGGARQRMEDHAVALGRQAQTKGQVPDVRSIARAVFGVPVTTLQQEYLVSSWLGVSGGVEEATPGPDVTPELDVTDPNAQSLMDTSELPRDEPRDLGVLDGSETLTVKEAELARAMEGAPAGEASTSTTRVGEGFPPTSLPMETDAVSLSSPRAEDVVVPELEIPVPPGLDGQRITFSLVMGEDSPVGQWADYVVARAMNDRRNNLRLMANSYEQGLGMRTETEPTGFVPGVLEGAGMLAPNPMRSGATYEQMRKAVDLIGARLAAGKPLDFYKAAEDSGLPRRPGVWRVLGWVTGAGLLRLVPGGARQRMKEYAVGLGRQAQADGQVPDVPSIARAVFGVRETTLQQEYLVTSWLGGSGGVDEATPAPASVSTSRDEGVVAPELVVPDPPSAMNLSLDAAALANSLAGRSADYLVARAMNDRMGTLPMLIGAYETELGIPTTAVKSAFVVGVLEGAGVLAGHPVRSGATYEQMRKALDLISARLAADEPFHPPVSG
ncbi:hypothetical protein [Streptomyces wedmorensis]|uniref:hypothetical protein n=1 Tax=Streptomyces wedmorensis TaxID=43759 RepID=UPI000525E955|nr:hypothetical protein [Streptomyces wedmorensis]